MKKKSSLDFAEYYDITHSGLEPSDIKAACATLSKALRHFDGNLGILLPSEKKFNLRQYLPAVKNRQEISQLAKKHGLKNMSKLILKA